MMVSVLFEYTGYVEYSKKRGPEIRKLFIRYVYVGNVKRTKEYHVPYSGNAFATRQGVVRTKHGPRQGRPECQERKL
jgi:hypothetical protein